MEDYSKMEQFILHHPISFHDYSGDKSSNYSGYGLKSIKEIKQKEDIMFMNFDLGLVSNVLLDEEERKDNNEEFLNEVTSYTE